MSGPPVVLGRDEARGLAEKELDKAVYHADDPTFVDKIGDWIAHKIDQLLDGVAHAAPGGWSGVLLVAGLVVLLVVVVRLVVGRVGRDVGGARTALFDTAVRSAADHRRAADAHAARGDWAPAVRERLQAVIRSLEERDLIAPAAGRTATEVAALAAAALPERADDLEAAAALVDAVVFGGRPATADDDTRMRAVDDAVARTRPRAEVA